MQNPTSELTALLAAGIEAVFHINDYEVHLWGNGDERGWHAMVTWYGDGIARAEADGDTPADALWNVSAPAGESAPYGGDFAGLPARLRTFTDAVETAAVARAKAEDAAAACFVAAVAA